MNRKEFQSACQRQGVDVTDKQLDQLEKYLHLLQEWNQKMNLTAIDEEDQIWEKHFYDCVIPFVHETGETICDVGSGAGFPGIPVAIASNTPLGNPSACVGKTKISDSCSTFLTASADPSIPVNDT